MTGVTVTLVAGTIDPVTPDVRAPGSYLGSTVRTSLTIPIMPAYTEIVSDSTTQKSLFHGHSRRLISLYSNQLIFGYLHLVGRSQAALISLANSLRPENA
jgi:hypothetical protein